MKSVRVVAILDESREVKIPVPAGLHSGETIEIEAFFHDRSTPVESAKIWAKLLENVEGLFEDQPLELPDDPPPSPTDGGA